MYELAKRPQIYSTTKLKDKEAIKEKNFVPQATCEWSLGAVQLQQDEKLSIKVKDYEPAWFKR